MDNAKAVETILKRTKNSFVSQRFCCVDALKKSNCNLYTAIKNILLHLTSKRRPNKPITGKIKLFFSHFISLIIYIFVFISITKENHLQKGSQKAILFSWI